MGVGSEVDPGWIVFSLYTRLLHIYYGFWNTKKSLTTFFARHVMMQSLVYSPLCNAYRFLSYRGIILVCMTISTFLLTSTINEEPLTNHSRYHIREISSIYPMEGVGGGFKFDQRRLHGVVCYTNLVYIQCISWFWKNNMTKTCCWACDDAVFSLFPTV